MVSKPNCIYASVQFSAWSRSKVDIANYAAVINALGMHAAGISLMAAGPARDSRCLMASASR